jgi:NAD(P)-dependent dehydrogenase (short-subunit alcohol dehydrogenase family)
LSLPLENKTALVTGATRGIGREIALQLSAQGCGVIAMGRSPDRLAELRLHARLEPVRCDVTSEAEVQEAFAALRGRRVDFLINNAGVAHEIKNVGELPLNEWQRVIDANLTSMFHVTSHALGLMHRDGLIMNVISQAATTPFVGFSAYNASKAGALAFTNTLREELREKGIRVCALVPGATETEIWNQFWPDAPRDRMVKASTVADLVARVCMLPPESSVDQLTVAPRKGAL